MKQPNKNKKKSFRDSFSEAKSAGKKTFAYGKKKYTTQTASEKSRKMSDKQLKSASNKAYTAAKRSGSKSHSEISESYTREKQYRMGDRLEKKNLNPNKYSDRMKGDFRGSAFARKRPKK